MGRTGITYEDVERAANAISARKAANPNLTNKTPTAEEVRQFLKTGSNSTITQHLKRWKNNQSDTQQLIHQTQLPEPLITTMKHLWQQLTDEAQTTIQEIEQRLTEKLAESKKTLRDAQQINQQQTQKIIALTEKNAALEQDIASLTALLQQQQKAHEQLSAQQQTQAMQLQEKQARIEELQKHYHQAQENLEHYREKDREQRQQLEQQIHTLQQQLTEQQKQHHATEGKIHQLSKEAYQNYQFYEMEKQKCETLTASANVNQQRIADLEKSVNHWQDKTESWQLRFEKQNDALKQQLQQISRLEAEQTGYQQRYESSQKTIQSLQDANKQLSMEKWELGQEKASLMGQLKQMERQSTLKLR